MLPPVGPDLAAWAGDIRRWLARSWDSLTFRQDTSNASQDGLMMWDVAGYPVVSKDGVWRQVVLADGRAVLAQDANVTAAAVNTAYKIPFDLILAEGVTLTGSPLTDITFAEGGLYTLSFAAQISSTSASTVTFRFWPQVNAVDAPNGTIVSTLHNNNATNVVSRTVNAYLDAGDVLCAMWAVDSTSGYLQAHAATAYAPAAPSVTLTISRVNA